MVNLGSIKDHGEIEIEKTLADPRGSAQCTPAGATWRGQGRVPAERVTGPRAQAFIGPRGRVLWGSKTKARLSIQKEQSLGKLQGWSYLRDTKGECNSQVLLKSCMRSLHLLVICGLFSTGSYLKHAS